MNRIKYYVYPVVTFLSLAAAVAAQAETPEPPQLAQPAFTSLKTREQAVAEYMQAKRSGGLRYWSNQFNPVAGLQGGRARAEVLAEVRAEIRSGHGHDLTGEDSGSFALAKPAASRPAGPLLAQASPR